MELCHALKIACLSTPCFFLEGPFFPECLFPVFGADESVPCKKPPPPPPERVISHRGSLFRVDSHSWLLGSSTGRPGPHRSLPSSALCDFSAIYVPQFPQLGIKPPAPDRAHPSRQRKRNGRSRNLVSVLMLAGTHQEPHSVLPGHAAVTPHAETR